MTELTRETDERPETSDERDGLASGVYQKRIGFATSVGRVRPLDEDSIFVAEIGTAFRSVARRRILLLVADGMGGHRRGDIASKIASQTMANALQPLLMSEDEISAATYHREFKAAVTMANRAIFEEARRDPQDGGMGTTLSLAVIDGRSLYLAHVGDSRVYVVNSREIIQVTRDHSLVQELVNRGELSPREARRHPRKNVITRVVGYYAEVTPDVGCLTLSPSDLVLVCCDGLTNHVEEEEIRHIVSENRDPQLACDALVDMANERGGTDNISVILAPASIALMHMRTEEPINRPS